jgi:pimeloyl-ACP methyl ester carboxylesterase
MGLLSILFRLFLALTTGLLSYNAYRGFINPKQADLEPALDASVQQFTAYDGFNYSYYADDSGDGRPLVLIHSINAAASAYELKPVFEAYQGQRPVYALDLPGFGLSPRVDRVYSPRLYTDVIIEFLELEIGQSADVVALSLGSEFAARAASERPDLIASLVLLSPTGVDGEQQQINEGLYDLLSFPLWSQAFYDALTLPRIIRAFLEPSFAGPVDEGLVEYDVRAANEPGARFAPLYFVGGRLDSADIYSIYQQLEQPVLIIYDQDQFVNFDALPNLLDANPNINAERIAPTRGLPQFEQLDAVVNTMNDFWTSAD